MKEGIDIGGTTWKRLEKLSEQFPEIAVKRTYVGTDSKINITLLYAGDEDKLPVLKIFLKSHFPTEDNCTVFIENKNPEKDYKYKIELIDVMVSR